jgi:hypothetical protein
MELDEQLSAPAYGATRTPARARNGEVVPTTKSHLEKDNNHRPLRKRSIT